MSLCKQIINLEQYSVKGDSALIFSSSNFIDNEQIDSAKVFIKRAKENSPDSLRQKAVGLELELKNYNSEKFANKILIAMDNNEFDELKSDNLSKTYLIPI